MSTYISVEGYFIFFDIKAYSTVREMLLSKLFINENGDFLDEMNKVFQKDCVPKPLPQSVQFIKGLGEKVIYTYYLLKIPNGCHRNLGHILDNIVEEATYYWYLCTCTDGCTQGEVGKHLTVTYRCELEYWAKKNKIKIELDDDEIDFNLLENSFWDMHDAILPNNKILESTFYSEPKKIKHEIVIGEYKNSYLVDTPEGTTLVAKRKLK